MMRIGLCRPFLWGLAFAGCSASPLTGTASQAPSQTPAAVRAPQWGARTTTVAGARGVIAALGDSVTLGISNTSPGRAFPEQLGALTHMSVVNLGARNALTADVLAREAPRIPDNATFVVLAVGMIDTSAASTDVDPATAVKNVKSFEPNFDKLVDAVRNRVPRAKIVIVTVRDLGRAGINTPRFRARSLSAAAHEWNQHEKVVAAQNGIGAVVDTETDAQWYVPSEYDGGRIHPTDSGAARLARAIAPLLGT